MDPNLVAKIAQIASVLEVSGHPKPGNVHRTQDFEDMYFEDFLISGIVIGDIMRKAAHKGGQYRDMDNYLHKIELGKLIYQAVKETDRWVENNTNLGIIMLLTPLAVAAGMSNNWQEIRHNTRRIITSTTYQDAIHLYDAINLAQAGGMGETSEFDVSDASAKKELREMDVNLHQVLEISSSWDNLAYELTHNMPITFQVGYPTFKRVKREHGLNQATVQTFLTILARYPDTLISRKYDQHTAQQVSREAQIILDRGGILTREGRILLEKLDEELRDKNYNPGTTADLTASSLMVAFLEEYENLQ